MNYAPNAKRACNDMASDDGKWPFDLAERAKAVAAAKGKRVSVEVMETGRRHLVFEDA